MLSPRVPLTRLLGEIISVFAGASVQGDVSEAVAPLEVVVAVCLQLCLGCVLTALSQQHSRMDGVRDDAARGGGRLEDAGPLLQVGTT